ncbi:MAG: ATP-binding domain-containing protein [Betaproteobacteria bacterium]|nr:ATP-binding domain-containing protein [Betaproteobacteria bacterium]
MAHIHPDGWRALETRGAAGREIETLARLGAALPDAYTVYHAVHWTNLERGFAVYGEIDFVVVNRAGDLLLIEQKSGFLEETPEGLVKRYAGKTKSVSLQLARTVTALRAKLHARCPEAHVEYLLYCPDYQVRQVESAGLSPQRIVDARRREQLAALIQAALPPGEAQPRAQEAHRFLRDVIQLETDVSALIGRARALVTRVSGGLAHWARQLEFHPYRLRVAGTAGSGKTQLALAEYRATLERGGRPLYVCYNRPLADHFRRIAPPGGWAGAFHMLCDQRLRETGVTPDFRAPGAFEALTEQAAVLPVTEAWRFDTVIVDEGQDFTEAWRDAVLAHAAPDARLLWLEDPLQNLYGRPPVALPGWVTLKAQGNCRSPRSVVRLLQSLLGEAAAMEAVGPLGDAGLEVLTYRDAAELKERVKEAIRLCYAAGFKRDDLALVSFRGREQSLLFPYTQLGPHTLRTFTGQYDLLGQPIYSEGDVLLETVYRFKGQSAPAVIFTEIDFETLDDKAARKLFVGCTRAMMKLVLVVSERSAARLLEAADGG